MTRPKIVTFTSDYGLEDEFVGVCHGVMLNIAQDLKIVDVHHNVLRQDVRHGAVVLQQSSRYLPVATHLAVVDPGVGSDRKAVAIASSSGSIFVGPDNGLLVPAAKDGGKIEAAFELLNEEFLLTPVSMTFQGRDVFAPAAAHVANGVDPSELGPEIPVSDLIELEIPQAWVHDDHLHGEVLQVDRFGNLQLNFSRKHLSQVGLENRSKLEVRLEGHRLQVVNGSTFADVEHGEFVLIEDSYEHVSLSINGGDARAKLRARPGSTAIVGPTLGE